MPYCLLLLVGALGERSWRMVSVALVVIVAMVNAGELALFHDSAWQKERWSEVRRYLDEQGRRGDLILVNPGYAAHALSYHYRGGLPMTAVPQRDLPAALSNLDRNVRNGMWDRVILITCAGNVARPIPGVEDYFRRHWRCIDDLSLPAACSTLSLAIYVP
jgi:hypothetical protein